jgi:hypothetical protein
LGTCEKSKKEGENVKGKGTTMPQKFSPPFFSSNCSWSQQTRKGMVAIK